MIDIGCCFTYAYASGVIGDFYQDISGAEEVSTNAINLDVVGIKIGGVRPPWLHLFVGAAATAGVSMEFKLVDASADDLTTDVRYIKYWRFTRASPAQLTAGKQLINEPLGHWDYQKYLGFEFKPFTACDSLTVIAWLDGGPMPGEATLPITEAGS